MYQQPIMKLSKTRLSEIENLPAETIDIPEIPELDDFWEDAQRIVTENYFQHCRHLQHSLKAQICNDCQQFADFGCCVRAIDIESVSLTSKFSEILIV